MVANVVLEEESALAQPAPSPGRDEVLARYRHLREISRRHHAKVLDLVSRDTLMQHARRLGLAHGNTLILDSMDDLTLCYDLAVYTAPADRSRAIDRYARSAQLAQGSDEALMLEAMRNARFALIAVERPHEAAGLIVTDLFRKAELWLVDEGLEMSLPVGAAYATRYYTTDSFVMTAGVGMPVDSDLITHALESAPLLRRKSPAEAIEDRRFAEAIYRAAIEDGITENARYQDVPGTGEAA